MRIRTRLTISLTALVMILIVTRSAINYSEIDRYTNKQFYDRLESKAVTLTQLMLHNALVDSVYLSGVELGYDLVDNKSIFIYDTAYRQLYHNSDSVFLTITPALLDRIKKEKTIKYREGRFKVLAMAYNNMGKQAIIVAGAIDKRGEELMAQTRLVLFFSLFGSLVVTALGAWLFVGRALKPISTIIKQVGVLSPVENSERLPSVSEKDEIAALVSTFNHLFDKLEDSFKLQKNFVANVSHEINNPLAKLKSQLEVSLMQNRDGESYRQTMVSVLEDVNELIDLIQGLMQFSRVSAGQEMGIAPVRIDELLFDVRDQVLMHFPGYNVNLVFGELPKNEQQLVFKGNRQLLVTAIKNIVENACKFSPDKTATLSLLFKTGEPVVTVQDNGPGIAPEDVPHIFQLFYRSNSTELVKGFGIGLALAHRIFKAHNIDIKVNSATGSGTTFTVVFSN